MQADSSEKRQAGNPTDVPGYYAVLLEWNRAGVVSGRRIVVEQHPIDLFNELSEWISTASEVVYEHMPMRAGHDDFAELFSSLVENYRIPDALDECLSNADVLPALGELLSNKHEELSHGADLEAILNDIGTFLNTVNLLLVDDDSYVVLACTGKLPEFGDRIIRREHYRYSNRVRRESVSHKEACWFGRLSIEMAAKGPWTGRDAYDPLLKLIEEFNEMNETS